MFLAFSLISILVLSYCVILFGSSAFAPKVGLLQRTLYVVAALLLTSCLVWAGCAAAGRNAHQVLWQPNATNYFLITFDSNKDGGVYRVHDWAPLWGGIPLLLSIAAGLAMRQFVGKHQPTDAGCDRRTCRGLTCTSL